MLKYRGAKLQVMKKNSATTGLFHDTSLPADGRLDREGTAEDSMFKRPMRYSVRNLTSNVEMQNIQNSD